MNIQKITPFLWYENQAIEAAKFYTSIFNNSQIITESPMMTIFELEGMQFMALNGGPLFKFTEAISFFVNCDSQEEVDELWEKLSEGGEKSQCGWLKDKFGLWWQIIPNVLIKLMGDPNPEKSQKVVDAMLKMSKIEIKLLEEAYNG
jgi:predicted 3-demethylubiquinone-9 3-methyltransferase (glyoxalase superfamily)